MTFFTEFFRLFIQIFLESAPWLLLGFAIAGVIKALIPHDFLNRHLGKDDASAVIKGALLGAPLPLCSCGVIPVALGLKRSGASNASTTSFLISTPETGIDSVSISYALLGPFMAIIRPIAAITTAIMAGFGVLWFDKALPEKAPTKTDTTAKCNAEDNASTAKSCCSSKKVETKPTLLRRIVTGLRFTFITLLTDISLWLLIGLLIAALIMTMLPESFLTKWGSSPYAYVIMAIIGVPMYICATASTPIASGLLFAGVSPGAILVFLLVGPATNIATLAIVKNELGKRVLAIYLTAVVGVGFLFGWLTDMIATQFSVTMPSSVAHTHNTYSYWVIACGVALALLLGNSMYRQYRNKAIQK